MKKMHPGYCALCGKYFDNLTYEHIPPKAAFNSNPVKTVRGPDFIGGDHKPWELEGLKYSNQQKGMGCYSLCEECNNNTGSWYGNEYQVMATAADFALKQRKQQEIGGFGLKAFYPLRFAKQVLSMFCSLNHADADMDAIRNFVMEKEEFGIDKSRYKLCMYFTESTLAKQAGRSVLVKIGAGITVLSEIAAYPLGFILYYDPKENGEYRGLDITNFCEYHYDDCCNTRFPLLIYEVNSWIPEDSRTKEEIIQCIAENKKWEMEHAREMEGI